MADVLDPGIVDDLSFVIPDEAIGNSIGKDPENDEGQKDQGEKSRGFPC